MKKSIFIFLLAINCFICASSNDDKGAHYNTYGGKPITLKNIVGLAPKMPKEIDQVTDGLLKKHTDYVKLLAKTPRPLTLKSYAEHYQSYTQALSDNQNKIGPCIGKSHFVVRFNNDNEIKNAHNCILDVTDFRTRLSHLIYASGQGSVLEKRISMADIELNKLLDKGIPPCQDLGTLAAFLRCKEAKEKFNLELIDVPNTYLKHIPGQPKNASDENYAIFQEWVPNIKELQELDAKERVTELKNMSYEALKEAHTLIVYAALWNHLEKNLSIDTTSSESKRRYCFVNIRPPFNNRPQDFYYQGKQGEFKYAEDVSKSLDRFVTGWHDDYKEYPDAGLTEKNQVEYWKRLTQDDKKLMALIKKHNVEPSFLNK